MSDLKARILAAVSEDLNRIEQELTRNLKPNLKLVERVARHILFAGGKRLRPLLTVLCGRLCGLEPGRTYRFSVLFEYLHAATLIHDDLVDGAPIRRGQPAAHHIYGAPAAVLTGDFLLARSLSLAAETRRPEVIAVIAAITENMSQGEIDQLERKGRLDLTEAEYLEVIRCKTAVLFQGACRVSAILADRGERIEQALADFGFHLGIAFQMADDLLDYSLDGDLLGKEPGADLREGKLTLPVIHALEQADAPSREQMAAIVSDPQFSRRHFEQLRVLLERLGGLEYTRQQAAAHVKQARQALKIFEPTRARDVLLDVADYALIRTS